MRKRVPRFKETRTIRVFLWFPKTLIVLDGLFEETRWLEFANILQAYSLSSWVDICWKDWEGYP